MANLIYCDKRELHDRSLDVGLKFPEDNLEDNPTNPAGVCENNWGQFNALRARNI